jgi:hypothetical protein
MLVTRMNELNEKFLSIVLVQADKRNTQQGDHNAEAGRGRAVREGTGTYKRRLWRGSVARPAKVEARGDCR